MEKAPNITQQELLKVSENKTSEEIALLVDRINAQYEYWDSVKYRSLPDPYTTRDLWAYVIADRRKHDISIWKRYGIHFSMTNMMQRQCHDIDMKLGGYRGNNTIIPEEEKEMFLVSSLMEEAISSSQMEGASTTRKIAKDMLRLKKRPKDKSQQMIHNNYQTIQFIVDNKDQALTPQLLLDIHRLITEHTLDNDNDAGNFRSNDNVVVENEITNEIVHIPPKFQDIPAFIEDLCAFFNDNPSESEVFLHPVIRGIIIHFMISFVHPFVDGNGRTARALFYWYMLKQGYWVTEYLSVSRIIYKRKNRYEKSFLYAENDGNDIGYFIAYNLNVLNTAFNELQDYLHKKSEEEKDARNLLLLGNLNMRQAEIIQMYKSDPQVVITVKDLHLKFGISPSTAKSDLLGLIAQGFIKEISFNKVKKGYVKGDKLENK